MNKVYIETTIPSYLASRPSRDLIVGAHKHITEEWWKSSRKDFELYISEIVIAEIERGDPSAIERRKEFVEEIPILYLNDIIRRLIRVYEQELGLPEKAKADVIHIAYAVGYKLDFLLTWNCTHIANGIVIKRLQKINDRIGQSTPIILTPEELLIIKKGGDHIE